MDFIGNIHSEIRREYDRARLDAEHLKDKRIAEVYDLYPRVKEIDKQCNLTGISIAKLALKRDRDGLENLKNNVKKLRDEKQDILKKANIPDDYFTNIYKCKECEDTGFISNERCNCYLQKLIQKYYKLSNVEHVLQSENFQTFDDKIFSDKQEEGRPWSPRENINIIREVAKRFIDNFDKKYTNLLLHGTAGNGKTFICHCIIKELLDKGKTVLYLTITKLCKIFEDYRFDRQNMTEPDKQMEMITNVDLLVIDDLGSEMATIVTKSALFETINERLLSRKPVIISTNLTLTQLEEQYTERITSRILGFNYTTLEFFGKDIRR